MSRLEQGILLVGESVKGGYYLTAVQSAYLNASNDSVVVNVSVKKCTRSNDWTIRIKI